MSKHASPSTRWALPVWLAAVAVFLICLGWVLFTTPSEPSPSEGRAESRQAAAQAGPVTVLDGLPAPGAVTAPDMPFAASQEYVLTGAGLQGFYQTSAPNDVWTLNYPEPELDAQLIRRGPPDPQVVSEGVKVTWRVGPEAGLTRGSTARSGSMEPVEDSFFRASIPVSAVRADGTLDPYPVVTLRAEDAASGKVLAESAAVLAVSPGFGCAHCHANAGTAILEAHDRHEGTRLMAAHAGGAVIDCRSCHVGPSVGKDGKETPGKGLGVSAAVHGWHAAYLTGDGADACKTCHVDLGRAGDGGKDAPKPLFARDFHVDRGLTCVRCHGNMADHALALLKAEQEAGQGQAVKLMAGITGTVPLETIKGRLPWVQEPDCTSCHNFSEKPDLLTASAFNKWTPRDEGRAGLFSERRGDMLMVRCIVCHGAPHAVYPARNPVAPDLDNIPPLQYQRQAAPLGSYGNCALCHGQPMEYSAHHPLVAWSETSIHAPAGARLSMPAARFSHQAHTPVVNCTVCHHTGYEDGTSLLCTSSGCHDGVTATLRAGKDAKPTPNPRYFYDAFHGDAFPGCLACHTRWLAEGKPAGPTDCKACHQAPSPLWAAEDAARNASGKSDVPGVSGRADSPDAPAAAGTE